MNSSPETNIGRHVLLIALPYSPRALWGCYGSFAGVTPNLDEFAANGAVLDRCILASPDSREANCDAWLTKLTANVRANDLLTEIAVPADQAAALVDVGEFQDEILDQILESGDRRIAAGGGNSLTVVRIPDLPPAMLDLPDEEGEEDDLDENDCDEEGEDEDSGEEEAPPVGFPHEILPIEEQIDWERIIAWQDRFLPEVIAEWKSSLGHTPQLVIVTTVGGCGFPFETVEPDSQSHECEYRVPCLVQDVGGAFAGTRTGALTSIEDLSPAFDEWLTSSDLNVPSGRATWWSILRQEIESLHERLYLRTAAGELLVWYPDAFLVQADPPRIYFKPEDHSDLDNIAPEQPRLAEEMLSNIDLPPTRTGD